LQCRFAGKKFCALKADFFLLMPQGVGKGDGSEGLYNSKLLPQLSTEKRIVMFAAAAIVSFWSSHFGNAEYAVIE
jgi:hypothetical protein